MGIVSHSAAARRASSARNPSRRSQGTNIALLGFLLRLRATLPPHVLLPAARASAAACASAASLLMTSPARYYTTAQAAKTADVSKNTLLECIQRGHVPEPERGWRGWRRWTQADIDRVIAHKLAPRAAPPYRPVARRPRVAAKVHS